MKKKFYLAFTLAEVLITLGIIGVVAAMTLPALIQKHRNQVVETRLAKIYSVMNQAILRSEVDNGPKEYWDFSSENFFEKYFAPYLVKIADHTELQDLGFNYKGVIFADGSMLVWKTDAGTDADGNKILIGSSGNKGMNSDYYFFPDAKNYSTEVMNDRKYIGSYYFAFRFAPREGMNYHTGKGFEPYKHCDNCNSEEYLKSGNRYSCNENNATPLYCTALIQNNGWKIPKDYPFKIR